MKKTTIFFLLIGPLFLTISCNFQNNSTGTSSTEDTSNIDTTSLIDIKGNDKVSKGIVRPYKFKNIRNFELIKKDTVGLIPIDSLYHNKVIKNIAENYYNYTPSIKNYYYSFEGKLGNVKLTTVKLFWDNCSEFLYLLITDVNNNLLNKLPVEEWSDDCESSQDFNTRFINDSTVNQSITRCSYGEYSEECDITLFNFVIKQDGSFDTLLFKTEPL